MSEAFEFHVPASCAHLGPGFGVLGIALDLPLRIRVEASETTGHTVERRGTVQDGTIDARHDAVLRGLHAAATRFEIKLPAGLQLLADSAIPPASGLGTQTAGFAAGLGAAARLARKRPTVHELLSLLVELGGDPGHGAAALAGGLAAACQASLPNEPPRFQLVAQSIHESWRFVIACPKAHISTADTRRILPPTLPHAVTPRTASRLVGLLQALADGDEAALPAFLFDEVHVPFRRRLVPGMEAAMAAAHGAGAAGVTISGHGPGIVALTTREEACTAIGAAMGQAFTAAGHSVAILQHRTARHGAFPV